ncbi:BapA prefix-like domain-containing protein [Brenneria goodwinii]|uniref:BapA/Bap/LapF family large adhesin n=3 Tax=Brenneria goodwinii TaxID=1109412 RepID=UPI000EF1FDF1|nr:BapA/Bap/LapF family large adhesin [Brenneria goodwinii]MCG8157779.1 BapA prefix-like domain-containing protein [Brenneria goodwinii]MCG8166640.1 BapA prefix-like domain-containing protein [Brenneria goodwinii]MCG8171402.1 BapA prefix-like domain-containing protein [Brenneria goodwinii]MCG8175391.1 BapA prefix-like domain-containing protein [Brenneria goodwinii]MCG8180540.1 BapA prefix-like domain-containing protein [Brenneria goodwinii]
MNNLSITAKESGVTSVVNASSGELYLSSPSIVKLQASRQDIASMTRSGNDLIVSLHSGEKVVLKNFYNAGEQGISELVLEESDGTLWWIKNPANQPQFESIFSIDEIMGGAESVESAAGGWPYGLVGLAGAAGVGGIIAIASDDGKNDDNRLAIRTPDAPTTRISEDGTTISGEAQPGHAIKVTLPDGSTLETVADTDGSWEIKLDEPLANGEAVTVTVTDAAGNVSAPVTATAPDLTSPVAPADLQVAEDGTSVSGNAEAGSTVTITDADGNVLGSVTVGEDGSFSVPLSPVLTNGEAVTVTVTDAAGNVSAPVTATAPDLTSPVAPADLQVAEDGTFVSGSAEAGSTVTITDTAGNVLGSVTVGEDGSFNVPLSPALTNGEAVTVTVTDAAGNVSAPVTATAPDLSIPDTTAPDAPVAAISEDGLTVSGTAEPGSTVTVTLPDSTTLTTTADAFGVYSTELSSALTNGEAVTVTATDAAGNVSAPVTVTAQDTSIPDTTAPDAPVAAISEDGLTVSGTAEAGSLVTVTLPDNSTQTTTAAANGTWSITLPEALTAGEQLTATATDGAGNVSAPVTVTAPDTSIPDTTAPDAPVAAISEDGLTVSGTTEPGSAVTVTLQNNATLTITADAFGVYSIALPTALTNGEAVTVTATDAAGNVSTPTTATAPDLTAPTAPADLLVAEDGTSVSGSAEAGSTVTITDPAGNVLGSVTVGDDGSFSVPLTPVQTNGEAVTVTVTDAAGNVSAPTTATAPDLTAPAAPADLLVAADGTSVSGSAETGSTVTITDADGNVLGSVTVGEDGSFSVPLSPALTNGEAVTISATDTAGNVSAPVTVTAPDTSIPDTTAPDAPVATISDDGTTVNGTAEPGSTVTVTLPDSTALTATADAFGIYIIGLPVALTNGEAVTVTATDTAGNVSTPTTATAPDLTAPTAPADLLVAEDGALVSGTAEAGSTVTITDADGNVLGSVTVGDDGSFSVPLSPALTNGEEISAVASDTAGNASAPVSVAAPDSTAPDAPVAAISEDGLTVSGTAEAGSFVTVTLPDNSTQTTTAAANGTWSITLPEALTAGEQLTATATDAAGNVSAPVTATAPDLSIPDTTAPDAPVAAISEDGLTVSGIAEPGSRVTVTLPDSTALTTTADAFGVYSIELSSALTNGEAVTVTATDAAGNVSEPTMATAPDLTAPAAPADLQVAADGTSVSGSAEAGSTVTITDADGNVLGSVTVGEDGSFSVPLTPVQTNGEAVTVTVTDAAGNVSAPTMATAPDLTAPTAPADLLVAADGTSVSGSAETGSTVTLTDADGNVLGSVTVGEDGSFSVPLSPALTNGEAVTISATDAAGNVSAPVTVTAPDTSIPDTTAPDAPVAAISEDGLTVSGTAEPGSMVTITLPDGTILTATTDAFGVYSTELSPALTNGEAVTVTATDAAGNVSTPTTATAPDLTAPIAPADLLVAADGTSVSGTAEPSSTVTITDADGNVLGSVTAGEYGSFNVPLSPALTNGEEISAIASDAAGNNSAPVSVAAPDLTAPAAPADLLIAADGTSVSGNAEAGSIVTITDADGNVLGSVTAGEDGSFSVPLSPALTNGEEISAVVSDAAGNASAPVSVAAPDLTAPSAPADLQVAEDGTSVSGTAEAGSTVTLTDADGNVLGSVTAGEDGSFSVPLSPALINGETLTAIATDAADNASTPVTVAAPDSTAPDAPVATISDDGTTVNGTAEPGSTVTVTLPDSTTLTTIADTFGVYSIALSSALTNGEAVTVTATDAAGNVSTPATAIAPDLTAPTAPADLLIAADGTSVSGSAEAGSTVTITDADGNVLGSVTVGEDGSFSVPLSPALTNGEAVTISATDAAGNVSAPVTVTAPDTSIPDTTAPDAPVATVSEDGLTVSGTAEPGSTVTVTLPDSTTLTTTADAFGVYSIELSSALTNGEAVTITATDAAGNVSTPTTVTAPDLTAPPAPADLLVAEDGASVSGSAEAGSTVTITDADGNVLGSVTVGDDGSFSVPLSPALTNGEEISVVASDAAGNNSSSVSVAAPDTTAPDAPVAAISEDGLTVSGTAEAESLVTVTLPDNSTQTTTAAANGTWSITLPEALTAGEQLTATATDEAGNVSAPVTVTAPDTSIPDTTAPDAPVATVSEDGLTVSGTAEPGSTVTVTLPDSTTLTTTADAFGIYSIGLPVALTNGEAVTVTATDAAGNVSTPTTATALDLTAPSAPADLQVAADGTSVSGSAEAGSTVTITDADGNVLGSVTAGEDGSFNVPLTPALTNGEEISAVVSDAAGNASAPVSVAAPDLTAPTAPADLLVAEDGASVSGTAEAGSIVTITDADGNVLGSVTGGEDGSFSVPLSPALTNGEEVSAVASDAAGNASAPVSVAAPDTTAPDAPVAAISDDGTTVNGTAEAGSLITVTLPDNSTQTTTAAANGTWSITLPEALTAGEQLTATATDEAGNVSAPVTVTAPDTSIPDTTAPDAPVAAISEDGLTVSGTAEPGSMVTITLPNSTILTATTDAFGVYSTELSPALTNGEAVTVTATDAAGNVSTPTTATAPDLTAPSAPADLQVAEDGTSVSGSAEAGSTVTLTDADGNVLGSVTVGEDGNFSVPLTPALTNGEEVSAVASDAAGNASAPVSVAAPDLTAPAAPADLLIAADGTSVSGNAEAGSIVTITDADGNVLGSVTAGEDGSFSMPLSPALTNGEEISAVVSDAAGNASTPVSVAAPDSTAPDAPVAAISDGGTTVNGTAEAGSLVTVTLPDNSTQTTTAAANGTWSITLPEALTAGEQLTATATDEAGNVSAPVTVTAPDTSIPDTTAPDAPVATISEDGLMVSGTAESGSTVTVTLPDSTTLTTTADAFGVYSIELSSALTNGEAVTITATDAAGNVSAPTTATAPDLTAPVAPADLQVAEDGSSVSGSAEAGSIVTITDADGNVLGSVTAGEDGSFSIPLSPALTNGEEVSAVASDAAGNNSAPVSVAAPDLTAPAAPADLLVAEDGASVSGTAEAGSIVTITDADGNVLGSVTAGEDGSFNVPLTPALTNGEEISAVASDVAGNNSAPVSVAAPDLTAPAAPADLLVAEDGASVSGSAEAGSTVTITDTAGNVLGSVTVGDDGNFSVPLSPSLTNGEEVSAVASDAAGNASAPVSVAAPDLTAPAAPADLLVAADGTSVIGTAEAGSIVTITDADGNVLGSVTAGEDGSFNVPLSPALTNGEEISAVASDTAGNNSAPVSVAAPDSTPPDAPVAAISDDGTTVNGTAEAGSLVTVTLPDNSTQTTTAAANGTWSITLPEALTAGEQLTATATDEAGNVSAPVTVTAPDTSIPDTTAPDAPVATISDDGTTVNGTAEPGSTVTVTLPDSTALTATADAFGVYSIGLPVALTNGEAVTVTAADAAGNVSAPTMATAPDLTAPTAPADLLIAADGTSVSGSAEAGSTVTLTDADGNVLGSVTVGDDGSFSVPLTPALTNGEEVSAVASDAAGNASAPVSVAAPDSTAPDAPVAAISEDGLTVSGTAEAGSTVTITDADGNVLGSVTVGEDGSFSVPLTPALTNGEEVSAVASDAAGNASAPVSVAAPDTTAPDAPVAAISEDGLTVSGTAEAGSFVTVTLPDNSTQTTTAAANGTWSVTLPEALTAGEQLTATATDEAGNVSAPTTATAPDLTAPTAPADLLIAADGTSVSGTAEPSSTVTITDADGNVLGSVTAGEDGSFSVPLSPALTNGEEISAIASDAAGNASAPVSVAAPDLTAPSAPADLQVAEDGTSVSGSAEAGSTVTITDADGNVLGSVTAGDDGSFNVPLTPALTNGEEISAVASDVAGNNSAPVSVAAPDSTAPAAPADLLVAADGTSVSGSAEAGSIVTITDADGNVLGSVTVGDDGSFSVPLSPALTNGEEISAVVSDAAGNASAPVSVAAPDLTAPDAPVAAISDDGTTVNGTAEAGSLITVTLPDNSTQTTTAAANGAWSITLPEALTAGEQLTATATDEAGNVSAPVTVTAPDTSIPDTTAPDAPVAVISEDGLTVSGTAEPGSTVTVTLPGSFTLTDIADDVGGYSVGLPVALTNGEAVTVTATDAAGNVSAPTTAIALDTTAPSAPAQLLVAEDGSSVSGTAEAGGTVTITDAAGNVLGSVTADNDGHFTVPLSPALTNGEQISAVASDAAGNASAAGTVSAPDTTAPDAPTATISDDGGSISGVAEGGSTVTITLTDGTVLTTTADAEGNYSYTFPHAHANGETVTVTATDAAGNVSAVTNATAPLLELAANDNEVLLNLTTDAAVTTESYSDWGLLVVGALGNIASLLGDDSAQVTFTIDDGATADVVLEANATGGVLSLLSSMGVMVQQYSADTDSWNTVIDTANSQWASLLTIGNNGVTLNLEDMGEGTYRALAYNTTLLAVGSFISVAAEVTQTAAGVVSGEISYTGNLITDDDPIHGTDITPTGTVVTQVANSAGNVASVTEDGTTIQGEYGTLTINLDGSYTYTLTDTSTAALGRIDSFTYTITANGATATADLLVSLGTEISAPGNVIVVDDSASITFDTTVTAIDNGASSQSGFTVLNLGLGSVLNVGILDDLTNPIIFDVEEGATRTMTLQASVGGVSVVSGFDLYIYKFNDATQQYDQYRVVESWLTVLLVGGSSDALTLTLPSGQYLFLLDTAYGISALTGYTLNIQQDHVYTVETVSAGTSGNVMEDDTAPEGSVISSVNGTAIAADGTTSIVGEYGVLTIDVQGNYTYTLNAGVGADGITAPDSFVYTVTAPDGESDSGTLNINLASSALAALDDSVTLSATAAQEETGYSDSDAGSVTWSSALFSTTTGSASGTVTVADNIVLKDASITFNVNSSLSLSSLSISWALLNSDGTELTSGTLSGGSATVSLGGLELNTGDYTLNFTGSIGPLSIGNISVNASVTGTSVLLDNFQTDTATVEGNIFDGSGSEESASDQLVSVATTLSITDVNGAVTTLNPYVTSDSVATVQGKYGVLTLHIDGEYSYTLNSDVALTAITEKETFNYTLTAPHGETASAVLTIDLALQLNGTSHSDIATSSVYDDTLSLGSGADTLIFNLLDSTDAAGGNGSDTWTDFSLTDSDRIDISQLLQGWDGSASSASDWISVETVNGNTVISIDRDGQDAAFTSTELVTLQSVQVTLDELLENNAINV